RPRARRSRVRRRGLEDYLSGDCVVTYSPECVVGGVERGRKHRRLGATDLLLYYQISRFQIHAIAIVDTLPDGEERVSRSQRIWSLHELHVDIRASKVVSRYRSDSVVVRTVDVLFQRSYLERLVLNHAH